MLNAVQKAISSDIPVTAGSVLVAIVAPIVSTTLGIIVGTLWVVLLVTKIRKERLELRLLHTKEAAGTPMDLSVGDDNGRL